MQKPILVYYKNEEEYRCLTEDSDVIQICKSLPKNASKMDIFNSFEIQKPYECNDEGLMKYKQAFFKSVKELKSVKLRRKGESIDYTKYYKHFDAIQRVFFDNLIGTSTITDRKISDFENVEYKEAVWIKRCNNGGLVYFDKSYKDVEIDAYGYDFKSFYPSILSKSIKIPLKCGIESTIRKLPIDKYGNVEMGYYHVYIEYKDPEFLKVFTLSKNHCYTNYSLDIALKFKKNFGVKVKIFKHENNCYLYNPDECKSSKQYFSYWFETLSKAKKDFPDNVLIKPLFSALWGHLSVYNLVNVYEVDADKINFGDIEDDEADYYNLTNEEPDDKNRILKCSPKHQIFKFGIARMMPFLSSYGRVKIANVIYPHIEKVVRIYTDGVVFNAPIDIPLNLKEVFVLESKTTGRITFKNSQSYIKST